MSQYFIGIPFVLQISKVRWNVTINSQTSTNGIIYYISSPNLNETGVIFGPLLLQE